MKPVLDRIPRVTSVLIAGAVLLMAVPTWPIVWRTGQGQSFERWVAWLDPVVPFGGGDFGAPIAMLGAVLGWLLMSWERPRAARWVLLVGAVALVVNLIARGRLEPVSMLVLVLLLGASGTCGWSHEWIPRRHRRPISGSA